MTEARIEERVCANGGKGEASEDGWDGMGMRTPISGREGGSARRLETFGSGRGGVRDRCSAETTKGR